MALSGTVNTNAYDGRYYQFAWSATQSVANNQSTVSWSIKAVGGTDSWYAERTLKVVAAGGTLINKTNRVERYAGTISSGSFVINHASDGTAAFAVSIQVAVYYSTVNCTKSATCSLNTIARTSSLTASNGTLGTAQTLTISRQDSTFKHKITYTCGSTSGYAAGSSDGFTTATSISWTPPLSLASQNAKGTSVSATLYLKTYNSGGTQIGQVTKAITLSIPSSVKPSVSIALSDPTGYLDTYGGYVQNKSKIKVVATGTGAYSSVINTYKTTANGSTYTASTFTTGVVKSSGTLTVSTTVTDSRNRSGSASKSITSLAYSSPIIKKVTASRCNEDGSVNTTGGYLKVAFSSAVSSLNDKNTASYILKYKKSGTSVYETVNLSDYDNKYIVSNGSFIFAADTASSYNISVTVTDVFSSHTRSTTGPSVFKLFSIFSDGTGWAFGKIAELSKHVEFGVKAMFYDDIKIASTKGIYGYNTSGGTRNMIHINSNNNLNVGYGGYEHSEGYTNVYGNAMQFISKGITKVTCAENSFYINNRQYGVNKVLWSGTWYMTAAHKVVLTEGISAQPQGIVLVFSRYSEDVNSLNSNFNSFFVPKHSVIAENMVGNGHCFQMNAVNYSYITSKYLYIYDTYISGNDLNSDTGSNNGVTYANNAYVLRYVLGV